MIDPEPIPQEQTALTIPTASRAGAGTINLNSSGVQDPQAVFDVSDHDFVTIEARLLSGTWGTAVITPKQSIQGTTFAALPDGKALTAEGFLFGLDVSAADTLGLDVTTVEGAAGAATAYVYGYASTGSVGSGFAGALTPVEPGTTGLLTTLTGTTSGGAVSLYTSTADSTGGIGDFVTVKVANQHTDVVKVTLEVGGVTGLVTQDVMHDVGLVPIMVNKLLRNGLDVKGFASVANVIECDVEVWRVQGMFES